MRRRTQANKYSEEELRLFLTQDVGYATMKRQVEAKVRYLGGPKRCL